MVEKFCTDIIIPARGGSKGLPRKNLSSLGGKPLIAWSIEAAKQADLNGRIVVSTDDLEIAEIAKHYGAEVPYLRPANISDEFSHPVTSVLYDLDWSENNNGVLPDYVVMLLPTSPFRTGKDISNLVGEMEQKKEFDAIISVYDCSGLVRAIRKVSTAGFLKPFDEIAVLGSHLRRQDISGFFIINGIYGSRPNHLRQHQSFIAHDKVGYYTMNNISAVDIDTAEDLLKAELLLPFFLNYFDNNISLAVGERS